MGTTLTGTTPQDTYESLIKVADNGPLSGTAKFLSDGLGNDSVLALSNARVGVNTNTPQAILHTQNLSAGINTHLQLSHENNYAAGAKMSWFAGNNVLEVNRIENELTTDATTSGMLKFFSYTLAGGLTEKMRIMGSGNVGIGTSAPAEKLTINGSLGFQQSGTQTYHINPTSSVLTFARSGIADVMSVTANGLCFGTDTAAANALDDYEEGTWTPTSDSAGYTISASSGSYTKIGRQVVIRGDVAFSAVEAASTSLFIFLGLPFTPSTSFQGVSREDTSTGAMFVAQVRSTPDGILNSMDGITTASQLAFLIDKVYRFTVTYFV